MNPRSSTESYPAFAHTGLRENPGKEPQLGILPRPEIDPVPSGFAARHANQDVQNVHLLLEYRPHMDVSLTCEHDPKLQEYCVCPQNMSHFDSEGIPNQGIRNIPGVWDRVRRSMRHRCEIGDTVGSKNWLEKPYDRGPDGDEFQLQLGGLWTRIGRQRTRWKDAVNQL
ncbi:hypothetical protein ANN_15616 [Periplaneta americana]|uniref:Uncharacterized protein n=1 Tax=Periplaneta americana TaxID=6978 RepID=A0ABQ8SI77_PERAM|nr:hypothetical protein ANN_15616 [Periplaneta americana]